MHVRMNIDSGRVRVDDIERRRRNGDGDGKRPLTRLPVLGCRLGLGRRLGLGWLLGLFVGDDHGCLRFADAGVENNKCREPRGYRGRLKSPQRDQYHAGETRHGKSPMTRSKPLGPGSSSGTKHQRENGHWHASPDRRVDTSSDQNQIPEPEFTGREGAAEGGTNGSRSALTTL